VSPRDGDINFEEVSLLLLLFLRGRLGRRQISSYLDIGEGVVKRILKNLSNRSLVETKRGGTTLSEKGLKLLRDKLSQFKIVSVNAFNAEEVCSLCEGVGFLIRNTSPFKIVEVRDEAVRGGAKGALIIEVKKGDFVLPPNLGKIESYFPLLAKKLKESFETLDGDFIIFAYSEELGKAIIGGLKASILAGRGGQ